MSDAYSPTPELNLLDRLIPFAYATHSGSFYALWRCDDRTDLATLPVIFFGDEGDLYVEAANLRELLRTRALEQNFALTPLDNPDAPDDLLDHVRGTLGVDAPTLTGSLDTMNFSP
ncbi:hypothetical protein GCM10018780_26100 [Streptomyces lanatus]|nr:hypothetical protein GCM10018780_26100 [Streptomyces lanatus]